MGGQVLGGGVIVLVAVVLWLVYLLPSWQGRHQFYAAAKKCFAVVQNSENRPYGCFILKKGVVFD